MQGGRLRLPVPVSHFACTTRVGGRTRSRLGAQIQAPATPATQPRDARAAGRPRRLSEFPQYSDNPRIASIRQRTSTPSADTLVCMSRAAKVTLAAAVLASAATIWTVHFMQRREREVRARFPAPGWSAERCLMLADRRCSKACSETTSGDERRCGKGSRTCRILFGSGRSTSAFRVCRVPHHPHQDMRHHPNKLSCLTVCCATSRRGPRPTIAMQYVFIPVFNKPYCIY